MILVTGGGWQGKLDFAKQRFALTDNDVLICGAETETLDTEKRCLAYVEKWALNRIRAGADPLAEFRPRRDAVVILTDISCGVVPMDAALRAWREACGRLGASVARESDEVWRLFCGLPTRLK